MYRFLVVLLLLYYKKDKVAKLLYQPLYTYNRKDGDLYTVRMYTLLCITAYNVPASSMYRHQLMVANATTLVRINTGALMK